MHSPPALILEDLLCLLLSWSSMLSAHIHRPDIESLAHVLSYVDMKPLFGPLHRRSPMPDWDWK